MKLLSRDEEGLSFLIGKRERAMMEILLARYPVLGTARRPLSRQPNDELAEAQKLLEEALAEQQAQNKRRLETLLTAADRFAPNEFGFVFRVGRAEAEWLLQVFNDIRVGSWVKLGSPTQDIYTLPSLTEANVELAWAMEVGNFFECALLEAIDPEG